MFTTKLPKANVSKITFQIVVTILEVYSNEKDFQRFG